MSGTPVQLGELDVAARVKEVMARIATDKVLEIYPRPRFAEVLEIDVADRSLVVQFPDEEIEFRVMCGAYLPLNVGQTVRIAGPSGARYLDDILGPASFDGTIGDGAETFVVDSEAEMLATGANRGDFAFRTDTVNTYILQSAPATTLGNWVPFSDPGAEAIALSVVAVHEAKSNPHPQYLTQAEGEALFVTTDAIDDAIAAHEAADDPHTQYVSIDGGDTILADGAAVVPLALRGDPSQTANLLDIIDGAGVTKVWVTAAGQLSGNGAGLTGLDADEISSGTLATARLHSSVWTSANDGSGSGMDADLLDGHSSAYFLPAADFSGANVLTLILGVDGPGSGLNADLFDGYNSDHFATMTDIAASALLTAIKTVDGSGSGLDADTLDGHNTDYFLPAADFSGANVLTLIKTVDGPGSGLNADLFDDHNTDYFLSVDDFDAAFTDAAVLALLLGVDGTGSLLDADKLDGHDSPYFATQEVVESMLGDLLSVGILDVSPRTIVNKKIVSNVATIETDDDHGWVVGDRVAVRSVDATFDGNYLITAIPSSTEFSYALTAADEDDVSEGTAYALPVPKLWSGPPTEYRNGMWWLVVGSGLVDFVDADYSGRFDIDNDSEVTVANGDWIIAFDPDHDPDNPGVGLTFDDMVFQVAPYSAETYVKGQISEHASDPNDPHSAAGYLTAFSGGVLFAPAIHHHEADIESAIEAHESADDPHGVYLKESDGDLLYSLIDHDHVSLYEVLGTVAAHEAAANPHPTYLTQAEGDAAFSVLGHIHDDRYPTDAEMAAAIAAIPKQVLSSDTHPASSARIFVGDVDPASVAVDGDLWIVTIDAGSSVPAAPSGFTGS